MTLNKVDRSRVVSATKEPDCHANRILQHSVYRECYEKIVQCEKNRIFCHHDMVHFLNVARLAEIFNLQEDLQISKKLVYGAALLHDIGRFEQYLEGIPHEEASARIAPSILRECGYLSEEIDTIVDAISNHRNKDVEKEPNLRGILYRADKMSRSCFACAAEAQCDWKKDKKNLQLKY